MSVPLQAAYLCPMKVCQSIIYLFVSNKKPFHLTQMARTGGELPVQSSKKGKICRESFPRHPSVESCTTMKKGRHGGVLFLRGLQGRKRSGWGPRQAGMSLTTRQRRGPVPVPESFWGEGPGGESFCLQRVSPPECLSFLQGRHLACLTACGFVQPVSPAAAGFDESVLRQPGAVI